MSVKKIEIESKDSFFDLSTYQKDKLELRLSAAEALAPQLAEHIGVEDIADLSAQVMLTKLSGFGAPAFRAEIVVKATVTQICGVSLEPFSQPLKDKLDVIFVLAEEPEDGASGGRGPQGQQEGQDEEGTDGSFDPDAPIYLSDGKIPLYAHVAEWLILGIDPYPVKPGADWNKLNPQSNANHEDDVDPRLSKLKDLIANKNAQ